MTTVYSANKFSVFVDFMAMTLAVFVSTGILSSATAQPVYSVTSGVGWVAATPVSPAITPANYLPVFSGRGWYVDLEFGNDANPGTLSQPWRTFAPTAAMRMAANDALLLKCGQVWRDTLTVTSSNAPEGNLLISGYGDCSGNRRPVIRASDWVSPAGWVKTNAPGREIYAKNYTKPVSRLFSVSQPLIKARFPNFVRVGAEFALTVASTASSRTSFKVSPSDLLFLADQDMVGATVYLKVTQWETQKAAVQAFDVATGVITLDRTMTFNIQPGSGYILEGKSWMLDAAGEWFFDEVAQQLRLWTPTGVSPAALTDLEASWRKDGLVVKWFAGLRVERIAVEQQDGDGIVLIETPGAVVSDVRAKHVQELGISVVTAANVRIQDSMVEGAGRTGIVAREADSARVLRNHVVDTGGNARAGATDAAIAIFGQGALAENNLIQRAALHGIRFANRANTVVRNNTVVSICLRFTDCAGVYTYTGGAISASPAAYVPAALVEGNIIIGAKSTLEGCGYNCANLALGIYMDELTSGVTVTANTISDTEVGIGLLNANFNRVIGNTVRGSAAAAFRGTKTRAETTVTRGNQVTGNTFFAHRDLAMPVGGVPNDADPISAMYWFHATDTNVLFTGTNPNTVSGNEYISVLKPGEVVWSLVTWSGRKIVKQNEWQAYAPTDRQFNPLTYKRYVMDADPTVVVNGEFNPAITASWFPYLNPLGTAGSFIMNSFAACGKTCSKLIAGSSSDYLVSAAFSLNGSPGQNLYLYKQTSIGGVGGGAKKAYVRLSGSPYTNLGLNIASSTLAPGQSSKDEIFFRTTGSSSAVVDLRGVVGGETFYSDVSLVRVRNINFLSLRALMSHVINPSFQAMTFPCSALAVSTCNLFTETGARVTFPLTVPARSSRLVFANDPVWLQ